MKEKMKFNRKTKFKDANGKTIYLGDTVVFWCGESGILSPHKYAGATKMKDVVIKLNDNIYAWDNDIQSGCFLSRLDGRCVIL